MQRGDQVMMKRRDMAGWFEGYMLGELTTREGTPVLFAETNTGQLFWGHPSQFKKIKTITLVTKSDLDMK